MATPMSGRLQWTPRSGGSAPSPQGALAAAALAVLVVLTQTIGAARSWEDIDWPTLGLLALQALLTALLSGRPATSPHRSDRTASMGTGARRGGARRSLSRSSASRPSIRARARGRC